MNRLNRDDQRNIDSYFKDENIIKKAVMVLTMWDKLVPEDWLQDDKVEGFIRTDESYKATHAAENALKKLFNCYVELPDKEDDDSKLIAPRNLDKRLFVFYHFMWEVNKTYRIYEVDSEVCRYIRDSILLLTTDEGFELFD